LWDSQTQAKVVSSRGRRTPTAAIRSLGRTEKEQQKTRVAAHHKGARNDKQGYAKELKKQIAINIDSDTIDYFKEQASHHRHSLSNAD